MLLLALCVSLGAYLIVKPQTVTYIQLRPNVDKESGQLLEAQDIEPLTVSTGGLFQGKSLPIPGLLLWSEASDLVGRSLSRKVQGGRPLLATDLEPSDPLQGAAKLNASMTGMSIPVDNVSGVSPHLSTGGHVHVYASFEDDVGAHSGLLLKNMPIIDVQREMEGDQPNLAAVTLLLSKTEAVLLTHALHYGKIRLGLAAVVDGEEPGIGDAHFAAELMKTKKRWGVQEEERE
ncbi:Flp pilus assembly protein CpaB [Brevibacillus sp. GCM10020057]|uniref:Flp pilus assembly protein CpaB n=1 Tax=Brevibacillus sp. GCM10020057 TaxID=3317327 RepID=UPI00362EDF26